MDISYKTFNRLLQNLKWIFVGPLYFIYIPSVCEEELHMFNHKLC